MVINKIIVCPVCGKRTLVRIENGGYLASYPIRVNCLNCKTLMKGEFNMRESQNKGFHMLNARIEEPEAESSVDGVAVTNADYIAEVSGELPCACVKENGGSLPLPPFMKAVNTEKGKASMVSYIERLKLFSPQLEKWKKHEQIAFQLLDDGSLEYIGKALDDHLGKYSYICDNTIKKLECLQTVVLNDTQYLFFDGEQDKLVKSIINNLSEFDNHEILDFIKMIGGIKQLIADYRKIIEVFSEFMNIYSYLLPAEFFMKYSDDNSSEYAISTCSFTDIKSFYQDAYETCLSMMYLPVCLDNRKERNDFIVFSSKYSKTRPWTDKRQKLNDDLAKYKSLDNGMKLTLINNGEDFQNLVNIKADGQLRNGIGHNNYVYDGITQEIITFDKKKPDKTTSNNKLISIAIECIGLVKSSVAISEMIMFLLRAAYRQENDTTIMDLHFYKNANRKAKCPCGSGIIYKNCCEKEVNNILKMYHFTHPNG